MKITTAVISEFQDDLKRFGLEVALHNFQWRIAQGLFEDLGAIAIKTKYQETYPEGVNLEVVTEEVETEKPYFDDE